MLSWVSYGQRAGRRDVLIAASRNEPMSLLTPAVPAIAQPAISACARRHLFRAAARRRLRRRSDGADFAAGDFRGGRHPRRSPPGPRVEQLLDRRTASSSRRSGRWSRRPRALRGRAPQARRATSGSSTPVRPFARLHFSLERRYADSQLRSTTLRHARPTVKRSTLLYSEMLREDRIAHYVVTPTVDPADIATRGSPTSLQMAVVEDKTFAEPPRACG